VAVRVGHAGCTPVPGRCVYASAALGAGFLVALVARSIDGRVRGIALASRPPAVAPDCTRQARSTWLGSLCDGESEHNASKRPGKARESLGGVCARAQHDARSTRGTAHSHMHMRHERGAHSYANDIYTG
jgi:hypothetical protein